MFNFHHDPSHGWLEVTTLDVEYVHLMPSDFTRYSYREGNVLYLEEDCDANKFLIAYRLKTGTTPTLREVHTNSNSFIRSLGSIH